MNEYVSVTIRVARNQVRGAANEADIATAGRHPGPITLGVGGNTAGGDTHPCRCGIGFIEDAVRIRIAVAHEDVGHPDTRRAKDRGMATPEQMAELAASEGTAFDRLFLKLMIPHHEGAVKMVEELLKQPGSAYDPVLFEFTTEITNGQNAEIARMNALLVGLSTDPRAALAAGFDDAGQALLNLELVASLPKPAGFFDPQNPAGMPPKRLQTDAAQDKPADAAEDDGDPEKEEDDAVEKGKTTVKNERRRLSDAIDAGVGAYKKEKTKRATKSRTKNRKTKS